MKKVKKIILTLLAMLTVMLSAVCFCGCETNAADATKLSFKSAEKYADLKKLDGEVVTINGYLATSSPANGSFIFLMNLPFQSCPFCIPNTSQLANTIEVYPKKNQKFGYTTQAVKVTGTLKVAEEGKYFTDQYGYEFAFKIVDAEYKILSDDEIAIDVQLWNKIADDGIVNDIYDMINYIHFVSHWTDYSVDSYYNDDGELVEGYCLWPSDAHYFIETDGAQFNYGYKAGYFDNLISKIEKLDKTRLNELVAVVERAKAFAETALAELNNESYTYSYEYIEELDVTDYVYTLDKAEELDEEYNAIYDDFSLWLASWEL